jgi:hypothetical protein
MTNVAILIPTTGRPQQMFANVGKLLEQEWPKDVNVSIYLSVPKDDAETLKEAKKLKGDVKLVSRPSNTTAVQGWNAAYIEAVKDGADWLVLGADDVIWHEGWLGLALKTAKKTGAAMVGLNDGHHDINIFGPHYLMSVKFTQDVLGGVYIPPHYASWSFDREVCDRAKERGLYAPCHEAMAEHLHPEWKTAEMDSTYSLGYVHHAKDRQMYEARKAAGWPMDYEPLLVEELPEAMVSEGLTYSEPELEKADTKKATKKKAA